MYSNRKPFLQLKKSLVEFFNAPVRYLKESNIKESQFEKPYKGKDYPTMHFDWPTPDWPSWDFSVDFDPWAVSRVSGGKTGRHCRGCSMFGWAVRASDCATKPVNIHAQSYCVPDKGLNWWDAGLKMDVWAAKGRIFSKMLDGSVRRPGYDIFVDPSIEKHVLRARLEDFLGNVCWKTVRQTCTVCDCAEAAAMTVDTGSSATEINPGVNSSTYGTPVSIYLSDGCPPFTWSITANGYRLGGAVTTTRENTLESLGGT